ncbi:hypothetical protein H2200_013243 [Cladophialophora chaetospira]|uniref:Uncharacterized protein n=1 Tax=Cladophialophora chaetospira TaxID=386627 RepID=A0AA39CBK8_9EURO|nr:hypothetical protein H2200_013243 [Cladophialophora chaetospira]
MPDEPRTGIPNSDRLESVICGKELRGNRARDLQERPLSALCDLPKRFKDIDTSAPEKDADTARSSFGVATKETCRESPPPQAEITKDLESREEGDLMG